MSLISKYAKTIWYVFRSVLMWCTSRKNWKTIRQYFAIAQELSKFAKKETAAKNIGWLAKRFDDLTSNYSEEDTKRAATEISSACGVLDTLTIGYSESGVTANIGPIESTYNPKNKTVKFGLKL